MNLIIDMIIIIMIQYLFLSFFSIFFKKKFDWYMYMPFGPHVIGAMLLIRLLMKGTK